MEVSMRLFCSIVITVLCLFIFTSLSLASSQPIPRHIKVGLVQGDEPISYFENDHPKGIAYDFLQKIAKNEHLQLTFIPIKNESDGYARLNAGEITLLAGAIVPASDHYHKQSYSLPFLVSHVGVVTRQKEMVLHHLQKELNDTFFWDILLYAALGQIFFSFLLWVNEHRVHPEFKGRSIIAGISFANWAIISAFLRDLIFEPKTARGRFIMGLWLLCSVIFMTVLASSVTVSIIRLSEEQASFIKNKTDLIDLNIGMHSHEGIVKSIGKLSSKVSLSDNEPKLFEDLIDSKVDAIVDNSIMLDYYMGHHSKAPLVKSKVNLRSDYFSFAMQEDSPLQNLIDHAILVLQESGESKYICEQYLNQNIEECAL
jgi:ABC-type amino acid transport substrate-binding protein